MSALVPSGLFEQDDEETLELLLLSTSSDDHDMKNRLDGMAGRFRDDFKGTSDESFWKSLSKSAQDLGFRVSDVSSTSSPATPPAANSNASSSFPAAFETESGKKHIKATSSLLRISETRAVQLTLSALRSLNGGNDAGESHLESLLGTRDLLKTVRDYHFVQRTCRLEVITECLRIEQDDEHANNQAAATMLDEIDKNFVLDGRKRGLFQRLLCVACAPYSPPTREELLPTLDLRSETPENLQDAQLQYSDKATASDSFVTDCFQASRLQTQRERVQAMEALLVLLYHRIDQGIHRIDYAIVLLAFQACGTFFTTEGVKRLSYLAGLVCAECMSLWMTASTETDAVGVPLWIIRHPLLLGVVECDERAVREMEALLMLLNKYASQVPARKLSGLAIRTLGDGDCSVVEAPEAVALFSFALLLLLVQIHMPGEEASQPNQRVFDFEKHGMACAQTASDDCGVFDYLHATMESLVKTPILDSFSSASDLPYDWQFSCDSTPLQLEGPSAQEELNAANVAYSSIGLELLSSTIIAFKSTIRTGNSVSLENVTMLCSLAATIYGNHPLLCDAFWKNLEAYTSGGSRPDGPLTSNQALCYLVDAAHACAASALNAAALASVEDHPGLEESILPSLVPLLQLMSSLCSSSGMVESVLKVLPKGMIRIALLSCAPTSSVKDSTTFVDKALQIVEAVQGLARVGRSTNCRAMLRRSLEEEGAGILDGPRVLYRIISSRQNASIVSSALRLMGYFVESDRGHETWVAKAAKFFGPSGLGDNGLAALLTGQSSSVTLSGLHVLSGFVGNMATIAFCPLCEQSDVLDVMSVVVKGVKAGYMLLTTLLPSSPNQNAAPGGLSYLLAHGVLRCSAMCLRELRPIKNMHASLRIKSAAQEASAILIQALSTSTPLGQAIGYFASAPVSLSLAIVLEEMLRNAKVMQIASDEYARETEPLDFGAWRSITDASREEKPAIEIAKVRLEGQRLVSNIHDVRIDLQGFQARGWTDETTATEPLLAASAALDLLRLWELSAEDIVVEHHGLSSEKAATLSQAAVSELQALSPCRLIISQILSPPVVEQSRSLRQVWPKDTLSLFDILVKYLDGADEENGRGISGDQVPSLAAADILSLSLVTSKHLGQELHLPVADAVSRCAPELSIVLNQDIENVAGLTMDAQRLNREISPEDDILIRKSLSSLRLLSVCTELDAGFASAICAAETSPLDGLVNILKSTVSMIRDGIPSERLTVDSLVTGQLRLTLASIHVLLSLFKTASLNIANQNVSQVVTRFKSSVVESLAVIVEFAALALSAANGPEFPSALHVQALLTALASVTLELLAFEMSRELGDSPGMDKGTTATVTGIMKASFSTLSHAFSKISGAVAMAHSWSRLESMMQSVSHVVVHDPRSVLCSFPATYRSQMESHGSQENLCDIVAASSWISSLHQASDASEEYSLEKANACFILLSKQLNLGAAWGQFATMHSIANDVATHVPGDTQLLMAGAVMDDLAGIATDIEEAQMVVAENYLPLDVGMIADVLASLLIETMSGHSGPVGHEMLDKLNVVMEKLLSATCLNRPNSHVISVVFPSYLMRETIYIREDTVFTCCSLQKRLLVAASLFFTALDQNPPARHSREEERKLAEVALKFIVMACKGLELVGSLPRSGDRDVSVSNLRRALSGELLEASVSLLTILLSRERGPRKALTGDSQFYANAAASMKRSGVMKSLVLHVDVASKSAVGAIAKDGTPAAPTLEPDESQVRIVQTIFSFVRTVAEIGQRSGEMLTLLSGAALTKMIVDNPLLIATNQRWVSERYGGELMSSQLPAALRGYLPLKGRPPVETPEGDSRTIVTGTFLSGRDDPVHAAWITAMQILEATVSAISHPRGTIDNPNRDFLDTAFAFLGTYYSSLIACLEQCSSLSSDSQRGLMQGTSSAAHLSHTVLTFNALCESCNILALVSSLCTGTHSQLFETACYETYHGMKRACHTVLDGLSEFLAAAGTAKEIFAAMKDYDAQLQESVNRENDFRFGFNEAQVDTNPLLAAGVPNAKHEAIKHAHYANRCCAIVTPEDYQGLPSATASSGNGRFSTSSLEKDSQLSMSSPFMLRMEHAAAECVSTATNVLSETHPASSSFVMFEVGRHDMLSLLREGMIISARPDEGASTDAPGFYRILHVDTVRRLCQVRCLDGSGDQAPRTLAVDRVNGVEDMSKRRPVLTYSAAPSSFADLESAVAMTDNTASLGDVIAVLRWCYQCTGDGMGSDKMASIRKVLAESASALLSTEVSLHAEIGTFSLTNRDELSKRVMAQLLQLFDNSDQAPRWSGRLKQIIRPLIWDAVQQQLGGELKMARNDRTEKQMQSLKKAAAINGPSPFFGASRQHGGGGAAQPLIGLNFAAR